MTLQPTYPISAADAKPDRILIEIEPNRLFSPATPPTIIPLAPEREVKIVDGRTIATSAEPWLRLEDTSAFQPGSFVEIVYRVSLFDDPVRPILRFRSGDGAKIDRFLPGPVAGAGIWVGRVPRGTIEVWISPTRHRGRFDFVVERARRRNGVGLWLEALRRSPRYALSALFYGVPGFRAEYDMNLDWALGFTPFAEFAAWRKERARAIEATGIDAPRSDWANGPAIHVILRGPGGEARETTLQSLRAQIYPKWQLHERAEWAAGAADPDDLVFVLQAGDRLEPHAFACAVEHAARHPGQDLFYADEIDRNEAGALVPALKPDWSPLLQAGRPFLGRAIFAPMRLLDPDGKGPAPVDLAGAIGVPEALPTGRIGHLRRMLLTRGGGAGDQEPAGIQPGGMRASANASAVSIIIPTRDRGDLLEKCVESIFASTEHPAYGIVIVDNGSTAPASLALLDRLGNDPRVTVLSQPGPFNFAALCNAGVALGTEPVLLFLNDDTSVRSADWLSRLSLGAVKPDIGAVGAKLLYPDGTVQHAGVSLGIGETAGHFGAGAPEADPGWAGRHSVLHEVSAVTGACLAVERRKFAAVGGFDSMNLPVELNDVDLCLRLSESGWKTVCLSEVSLWHEESASRGGAKFRLLKVHQEERMHFVRRWRRLIRDDPYFHPAFSLFRRQQALG